jgi:hypothetical protein
MIAGENPPQPTSIEDVWQTAWRFAEADDRVIADLRIPRRLNPSQVTDSNFLRQCSWAIFGARRPYEVLKSRWPAMEKAFFYWDVSQVVEKSDLVKAQVLRILNSPRKVDGVLNIAKWLNRQGWPVVRAKLLDLINVYEHGNPVITNDLLKWLDQLPWIGRTLAAYIAKDLGVSSIKDDVRMRRLAGWLGYSGDATGVWKMALDMQVLSNEKINVIDTVLWNWVRTQQWLAQSTRRT